MRCTHRPFDQVRFTTLLLVALAPGCGGQTPADPDQARATLTQALDAWRDGRTIEDMTNGSPPIAVADPYWKDGFKLSRYEVAEKTRTVGFDLKMPVKLWLEDPKGKTREETVKYTVSVQPSRTVIRAPF
jgi:hypothetical protein